MKDGTMLTEVEEAMEEQIWVDLIETSFDVSILRFMLEIQEETFNKQLVIRG